MKRRRRIVIILSSIPICLALSIFALRHNAVSSIENDFVSKSNAVSPSSNQALSSLNQASFYSNQASFSSNPDSLKPNKNQRHFYNIQTEEKTPLIELNTADTLDLQVLRGVGPAYAAWISYYRNRLGGFHNIEQLKEVRAMTQELYQMLIPQVRIDTSKIVKLNINTATIKQLNRHPYISYYLAKAIVQYRIKEGRFRSLDQLKSIYILSDSTFNRLKPYLIF
ncbi:MAG: ComEA family DNA-binding protein [Bacteroidales bacterium]|jgi:competence ComEA-like helix-hairpin-helix protein|nr:ComEA family DNA-binding protein [Bacteroidales bacterium]